MVLGAIDQRGLHRRGHHRIARHDPDVLGGGRAHDAPAVVVAAVDDPIVLVDETAEKADANLGVAALVDDLGSRAPGLGRARRRSDTAGLHQGVAAIRLFRPVRGRGLAVLLQLVVDPGDLVPAAGITGRIDGLDRFGRGRRQARRPRVPRRQAPSTEPPSETAASTDARSALTTAFSPITPGVTLSPPRGCDGEGRNVQNL